MKFVISAIVVILVAFGILNIEMSTSSSRICFVVRARATKTNDSFSILSRSKQSLEGQEHIDELALLG